MAQIAMETLGLNISLPDDVIRRALDPAAFVNVRATAGGAAPMATEAVLDAQAEKLAADRRWLENSTNHLRQSQSLLSQEIQAIMK
jgi:hypothetical protein